MSRRPPSVAASATGSVEHRPRYHVRPPTGWINDPNAPVQVDGEFHLFCQYNPNAAVHGDVHWAHFTSRDLLRWRMHAPALVPDRGGADADGCWSGSAVTVGGGPALLYSGHHLDATHQNVCLAWPTPDGRWRKDEGNPVIAGPPPELSATVFRDPFVWREEHGYACLMGAGLPGGGGAALLYRSDDLREWRHVGPLCTATGPLFNAVPTGDAWECPQLARWGSDGILLVSAWLQSTGPSHTAWVSGEVAGDRLVPRAVGPLDAGPDFYAPALTMDAAGRCLLWGWSWEARPAAATVAAGWAGVLTLPRELRLGPDGAPRLTPAAELLGLRGAECSWPALTLADGEMRGLETAAGDAIEIVATLVPSGAGRAFIRVRASPDWTEHTEIGVDAATGEAYLDREAASTDPAVMGGTSRIPVGARPGRPVQLRIFVDRSIVEVYVDDTATITARIYPTDPASLGLAVGTSGTAAAAEVRRWRIATQAVG